MLYLVEDDMNIRELIIYALKTAGFHAIGFEEGKDFFAALEKEQPTLVLLDIMLPNDNGLEILKRLKMKSQTAEMPVIMLTAKGSEFDKVNALDLGADDYITKPFGVMELISRVRAVIRRTTPATKEDILEFETIKIDVKRRVVTVQGEEVSLTFKEFELLHYLMQNNGIVLSRDKIMQVVWGFDFEGESRTVDMHIKLLRQKLQSAGNCIKTVRGVGYKIEQTA
ncbi:MAG: response regulator transcription factor [Oscillospiraceae bacterium]